MCAAFSLLWTLCNDFILHQIDKAVVPLPKQMASSVFTAFNCLSLTVLHQCDLGNCSRITHTAFEIDAAIQDVLKSIAVNFVFDVWNLTVYSCELCCWTVSIMYAAVSVSSPVQFTGFCLCIQECIYQPSQTVYLLQGNCACLVRWQASLLGNELC